MFLLGFALGRSGVLRDIPAHVVSIGRVRNWGLGLGLAAMAGERVLAATAGYAVFRTQGAGPAAQLAGDLLFAFGVPALALGYAATILLAAQTPRGRAVLAPLAPVGRLALTVYLSQTLVFTTLFYGYGFGQAFRLGPAAVTAWAVVIFGVQVVACQWWSRRFRFGPVEWLWRGPDLRQVAAHAPHERLDAPRRGVGLNSRIPRGRTGGVSGESGAAGRPGHEVPWPPPAAARRLSPGGLRSRPKNAERERLQGNARVSSQRPRS